MKIQSRTYHIDEHRTPYFQPSHDLDEPYRHNRFHRREPHCGILLDKRTLNACQQLYHNKYIRIRSRNSVAPTLEHCANDQVTRSQKRQRGRHFHGKKVKDRGSGEGRENRCRDVPATKQPTSPGPARCDAARLSSSEKAEPVDAGWAESRCEGGVAVQSKRRPVYQGIYQPNKGKQGDREKMMWRGVN